MRRRALLQKAWRVGLGSASIILGSLCGCSWNDVFSPQLVSLPNSEAVDRALRLCSLSEGDRPYHLVLEIAPPAAAGKTPLIAAPAHGEEMRARVEIFWLNRITYRTVIRSRDFNQVRIVNGQVTEEHDTGDFYPRWIQNFVDAILDPIPQADKLRGIPGTVPVGVQSHACISNATGSDGATNAANRLPEDTATAQVCFQDAEPRIASGVDFTRSVWFDDFAPFGRQEIARTLVNNLPANVLMRGQITLLEPLKQSDYPLLKAHEFTLPEKVIQTSLVAPVVAQSMLEETPMPLGNLTKNTALKTRAASNLRPVSLDTTTSEETAKVKAAMRVYVRTDRTGRVREAYRDKIDQFGLTDAAVARALTLKFKPLIVNGVAHQMEAPISLP